MLDGINKTSWRTIVLTDALNFQQSCQKFKSARAVNLAEQQNESAQKKKRMERRLKRKTGEERIKKSSLNEKKENDKLV